MGCGAAFFDYDHDGWLDIFLVNGTSLDPKVRDSSRPAICFTTTATARSPTSRRSAGLTHSGWGQACCVGDYDNDGFDDLFVTYWGRNVLYHNNGDGTFTDVSEKAGVAGSGTRWGAGCCFLDYDRDGHLDLFVANYVNFDPDKAPRPGDSAYCRYNEIPVPCGPLGFAGGTNILYRNRGDGTFADVSEQSGIARPRGPSSMVFVAQQLAADRLVRDGRGGGRFRQRRVAGHLRGLRHARRACCIATTTTARSGRLPCRRACARRARRRACRHGRGRRRLRRRRLAGHRPDELLRAGHDALPELRRRLRGRQHQGRPWHQPQIRRLRRGLLRLRQRRLEGYLHRQRPRLLADRRRGSSTSPISQPKLLYRNLGNGRFEDVSAKAGAGNRAPRTSAAAAPSATSTTTATWTSSSTTSTGRRRCCGTTAATANNSLLDQVRRHALEPIRDRHAREGDRRRAHADRRSDERVELLLAERFPAPLRPGRAAKADTVEIAWPRARRRRCGTCPPTSSS